MPRFVRACAFVRACEHVYILYHTYIIYLLYTQSFVPSVSLVSPVHVRSTAVLCWITYFSKYYYCCCHCCASVYISIGGAIQNEPGPLRNNYVTEYPIVHTSTRIYLYTGYEVQSLRNAAMSHVSSVQAKRMIRSTSYGA